jgi:outer membrane protein
MKRIILALTVCVLFAGKIVADETTNVPPVLTLADAQKLALHNHPQIAAANYRARAAEEVVKETRSGYFPTANLYATAAGAGSDNTRIMAGGLNNPSVYDRAAGGLAVSQLITDFGHTANLTASSKFQAQAENQNVNTTREQVWLQVDTSYFGLACGATDVCHAAIVARPSRRPGHQQAAIRTGREFRPSCVGRRPVAFAKSSK